jgi:hypothetical protein
MRFGRAALAILTLMALAASGLAVVHLQQALGYKRAVDRSKHLRLGMTISEVDRILGAPERVWVRGDSEGRLSVSAQYAHVTLGLVEFVVQFAHGRDSLSGASWDGAPRL